MGGAIFIEDGIETKNIIQYNLAVFVKQSTSLLNDDVTPGRASFDFLCFAWQMLNFFIDFIANVRKS